MPILRTSNFCNFLHASMHVFPQQWAFLSSHWNINWEQDGNDLTEFKERQVFVSLCILQHQSNVRCLLHWCLILSTARYGWGTRDVLGHATSFTGTTVSRSYWNCFYTSLTSNIVNTGTRLLSREILGLMVLDNFQRGNQLRDQCGGRSCKFLIGTTEAAHWVFPFFNFTWDHWKIEMTYSQDQIISCSAQPSLCR